MAQNECQQMVKDDFFRSLRNQLSTVYNTMSGLKRTSEFLNTIDSTTATNMNLDAQTVTDLLELRTDIDAFLTSYEVADGLKDQINKLRYL